MTKGEYGLTIELKAVSLQDLEKALDQARIAFRKGYLAGVGCCSSSSYYFQTKGIPASPELAQCQSLARLLAPAIGRPAEWQAAEVTADKQFAVGLFEYRLTEGGGLKKRLLCELWQPGLSEQEAVERISDAFPGNLGALGVLHEHLAGLPAQNSESQPHDKN